MEIDLAYSLAGLVVGFVVGLTGIGGGALMTPILVLGFGVNMATAVGTDLVYAAITKANGAWVYARNQKVRWPVVRALLLGSVPGALVSVWLLSRLPIEESIEKILNITLSVALILSALALFFRPRIQAVGSGHSFPLLRRTMRPYRDRITVAVGFGLGILVTLSSVGAGALGTAALILLFPSMGVATLVGTDLAHAVILATVAGLGHLHLGTVDYLLLFSLLIGSIPGVYAGSLLGNRLPERYVRPAVASVLLLIGLKFAI